jgi:hypothetical protein
VSRVPELFPEVEKTLGQVHWLNWRILWRGLKYSSVKFSTAAYKT